MGARALDFGAKTFGTPMEFGSQIQGFAPKSRVYALLGAKALDFGAEALDFCGFPIKSLVESQVGQVSSWMGAVPLEFGIHRTPPLRAPKVLDSVRAPGTPHRWSLRARLSDVGNKVPSKRCLL